jgi:hypothetical protein
MRDTGRLPEAESMLKEALDGRAGHPLVSESRYWYARTLLDANRLLDAEREALTLESELTTQPNISSAKKRRSIELLRDVYAAMHRAEPAKGFDAKAAMWQAQFEEAATPAK